MNLRSQIMALPEDQRLEAALTLLEDVSGQNSQIVHRIQRAYGLTLFEARIVAMLHARAPNPVSRDALQSAVWGYVDVSEKNINILMVRVRRKLPVKVTTVFGSGWCLDAPLDLDGLPDAAVQARSAPRLWTVRDDLDLQRMLATGSDVEVIAEELDRSVSAVQTRLAYLRRVWKAQRAAA